MSKISGHKIRVQAGDQRNVGDMRDARSAFGQVAVQCGKIYSMWDLPSQIVATYRRNLHSVMTCELWNYIRLTQ